MAGNSDKKPDITGDKKPDQHQLNPHRPQILLKYCRNNPHFLRDPASFPHTLKLIGSDLASDHDAAAAAVPKTPEEVLTLLESWKQRVSQSEPSALLSQPSDRELRRLLDALESRLTFTQITLILQHLEVVGSGSETLWPTIAVEMRALKFPARPEVYWRWGFDEWGQQAKRAFREDPDGLSALQQRYVDFLLERGELESGGEAGFHGVDPLELVINHCRTCLEVLKVGSSKVYLFEALGVGTTLADKINVCFGSGISVEERLPKYVCGRCVEQVEAAYWLKMQIDRTDEELRSLMAEYSKSGEEAIESQAEQVQVESTEIAQEMGEEHLESDVGMDVQDASMEVEEVVTKPEPDMSDHLENEEIVEEEEEEMQHEYVVVESEETVYEFSEEHDKFTIRMVDADTTAEEQPQINTTDDDKKPVEPVAVPAAEPATEDTTKSFYQCTQCRVVLRTYELWQTHKARHEQERNFTCSQCTKKFRSASTLKVHERIHTNEKPYVCDICDKSFAQNTNLVYHRKVHQNIRDFPCLQCSYRARNQNDLNLHARRHTGAKPYVCEECQLPFSTSSNLSKHVKRRHMGERKYKVCGKAFRTMSQIQAHGYVHDPKGHPIACEHCPYRTTTKSSLAIHLKSHQPLARPYLCPECRKGFTISSNMHKHVRVMHEKRKPFKCDQCDKTFTTKETAQKHLVTHTGSKPFHCPECNVAYGWYNGLQKHLKSVHPGAPIPTEKSMMVRVQEELQREAAQAVAAVKTTTEEGDQ